MAWWRDRGESQGETGPRTETDRGRRSPSRRAAVDLHDWPKPDGPALYERAQRTYARDLGEFKAFGVVQRWSGAGRIGLLWLQSAYGWEPRKQAQLVYSENPDLDVVIVVGPGWGPRGPEVDAVTPEGRQYSLCWEDLSIAIGGPVPWWPIGLRDPELIVRWQPEMTQTLALAGPEVDVAPLLQAALAMPDGDPAHRVLTALARTYYKSAANSAESELESLNDEVFGPPAGTLVVAATPLNVGGEGYNDLPDTVRRIGWVVMLGRADRLADACVNIALDYCGSRDFPDGPTVYVRKDQRRSTWLEEFIGRLQPCALTVAHRRMPLPHQSDTASGFSDPVTGAPGVVTADGEVWFACPHRLPTDSALAELILDTEDQIWVRVADGTLYPAPHADGAGINWGYHGSGPHTLASLVDRLLDDITAPVTRDSLDPPGQLLELFQRDWDPGTVFDQNYLEEIRRGRAPGPTRGGAS